MNWYVIMNQNKPSVVNQKGTVLLLSMLALGYLGIKNNLSYFDRTSKQGYNESINGNILTK